MKPLISIIVPIYNVEDYLPRCLNSLSRQSLSNIEVIMVNDASPDRCGEICEEYVAKDKRFKLFRHQANKGLSAARNTGLQHAVADYLMFVDSDDWVHEDFCKIPYECAVRYQADLVMFDYQSIYNLQMLESKHKNVKAGYKTREEAIELLLKNPSVWNKLYRKNLFNGIFFPEGYMFEDAATTYKLFWNASSIFFINKSLYYYLIRTDSITRLKTKNAYQHWCAMNLQLYMGLAERGYSKERMHFCLSNIAFSYCMRMKQDYSDPNYVVCSKILQNSKVLKNTFTWKQKLLLELYRFSPNFFDVICFLWGKKL